MNRNMKIAFLFAVCAVSVVSFCGEAEAASGVFETLRQKTATFASQLRVFAYAISCFGIVMFTFLAISGKTISNIWDTSLSVCLCYRQRELLLIISAAVMPI